MNLNWNLNSYATGNVGPSVSNGAANHVDSSEIQAAGFISGQPSSMTSKPSSKLSKVGVSKLSLTPTTKGEETAEAPNDLSSRAIEFHEGWTPSLYT